MLFLSILAFGIIGTTVERTVLAVTWNEIYLTIGTHPLLLHLVQFVFIGDHIRFMFFASGSPDVLIVFDIVIYLSLPFVIPNMGFAFRNRIDCPLHGWKRIANDGIRFHISVEFKILTNHGYYGIAGDISELMQKSFQIFCMLFILLDRTIDIILFAMSIVMPFFVIGVTIYRGIWVVLYLDNINTFIADDQKIYLRSILLCTVNQNIMQNKSTWKRLGEYVC